jgi:hypothetical protein
MVGLLVWDLRLRCMDRDDEKDPEIPVGILIIPVF